MLNYPPWINATAALHDAWANGIYGNSTMHPIYNFGTMLPAAATAYLAILNNYGLTITPPQKEKMSMAKQRWVSDKLRLYRNIFFTVAFTAFAGACVGGTISFDNATNDLIGKNIDYALLGPGYYFHPIAK